VKKKNASAQSVLDFRAAVSRSFSTQGSVLLNVIDALAVGPRPASPVEVTGSALFAYHHHSLYQGLRRGASALGEKITSDDWLLKLRSERLSWLRAHPPPPREDDLGGWTIRILDATNHSRRQAKTVQVGYVHGVEGMKPGIGHSILSERVGEGSWTLPLEISWMAPEQSPTSFGAAQIEAFVAAHGWPASTVLTVDSQYTVRPFLKSMIAQSVPTLGRLRNNRCFYVAAEGYGGFGRPAQLGPRIKLNEPASQPEADLIETWKLARGGWVEGRRWNDVRQTGWAQQPLTLYQIIEYEVDGKPRYSRPLWLLFVGNTPRVVGRRAARSRTGILTVTEAEPVSSPDTRGRGAPTPRQASAIYGERFSIEHAIRFKKQELGMVSGQFNGLAAEGREQTWVELVATAFWLLWAMREMVEEETVHWPAWWRSRRLTPGAMRRLAAGLFLQFGWQKPEVKPRGKSPGRAKGANQPPRKRFKVYRVGT